MFISCESVVRVFDYKAICRICFHYWLFSNIIPCLSPISWSHILKWIQWNILRKSFPVVRMFKKFTQHRYKKNPCKSLLHCNYKMCRTFPFYFWKSKYAFLSKGGNKFLLTILALKNNLFLSIFVDCNLEIHMHYDILRLMKLMKVRKTITFLWTTPLCVQQKFNFLPRN